MKKLHILNIFAGICLILPLYSIGQPTDNTDTTNTTNTADTVKITGMNAPFEFRRIDPTRPYDRRMNKRLCVYSSTGSYRVKITDINNPSRFETNKPNTKPIAYQVFWNNNANTANNFELQPGQTSHILSGARGECPNSGYNANLEVIIRGAAIRGAKAGRYRPQLSITVTPAVGP